MDAMGEILCFLSLVLAEDVMIGDYVVSSLKLNYLVDFRCAWYTGWCWKANSYCRLGFTIL